MYFVALIPARGGSKDIPRKNIKDYNGHPLITYSIKIATESKYINEIIVSTDVIEIKEISEKYGAKVPFFYVQKNTQQTILLIHKYYFII